MATRVDASYKEGVFKAGENEVAKQFEFFVF